MLGRRSSERAGSTDRRDYPRPPLRLNLILLVLALAALAVAARQRRSIDADYARVYGAASASPELIQVKAELADMDLTRETLGRELDSRLAYLEERKSRDFFLSIDTAKGKLHLNLGTDSLRDANVTIGAPAVVEAPGGKSWVFVPLKGSFLVAGKEEGLAWRAPAWVYAMNAAPEPSPLPVVANGLGKYVILLPNDYVIHSPPAAGSPLKGAKPGSFMVPEADLRAIWDRITPETRVHIF